MVVSRAMRKLLNLRKLEEEQAHLALGAALGELGRLENAQSATVAKERRGRGLVAESAGSGELEDRLAGIEESRVARRSLAALRGRIAAAEREAAERREEFLARRVERRQAGTLIEDAEASEAAEAGRRGQQSLDEWFLSSKAKPHR